MPRSQPKHQPVNPIFHSSTITRLLGLLGLGLLLDLTASLDALEDVLTVLVDLKLGDDNLRWVDAKWDGLSRGLLADDTLDVNDVLKTVDGGDLSLTALVGSTDNGDLVVLSDWDRTDLL